MQDDGVLRESEALMQRGRRMWEELVKEYNVAIPEGDGRLAPPTLDDLEIGRYQICRNTLHDQTARIFGKCVPILTTT